MHIVCILKIKDLNQITDVDESLSNRKTCLYPCLQSHYCCRCHYNLVYDHKNLKINYCPFCFDQEHFGHFDQRVLPPWEHNCHCDLYGVTCHYDPRGYAQQFAERESVIFHFLSFFFSFELSVQSPWELVPNNLLDQNFEREISQFCATSPSVHAEVGTFSNVQSKEEKLKAITALKSFSKKQKKISSIIRTAF